ncbi:hypothetical protein HY643_01780 [Candidatus Woesearchaeota archaeon]|nr:hypothetical protein [Candidatus Woesearchaeota archaeon]
MESKIVKLKKENNDLVIRLDRSPFREAGGGQPCDTGTITTDSFKGKVMDVLEDGSIKVKVVEGSLSEGEDVIAEIDEGRRKRLTRMHTAEHMLFKAIHKTLGEAELEKIQLGEEESSVFISTEKNFGWEQLFEAEKKVNEIIKEDKEVLVHEVGKDEVVKFKDLRIKLDKIKTDKVRVIEVKDFDFSACSGTHCSTTSEVGNVLVTHFRGAGKNSYEIKFKVDIAQDLYEAAKTVRLAKTILGVEDSKKIVQTLQNLKNDFERYKKQARQQKLEATPEKVGEINFVHALCEDFEAKELVSKASELVKEKTVVCLVNKTEKNPQLIVLVSKDLSLDASQIIKHIAEKFGGRGGGKKDFAMASFEGKHLPKIFEEVKMVIKK